jgi:hypothetical protein
MSSFKNRYIGRIFFSILYSIKDSFCYSSLRTNNFSSLFGTGAGNSNISTMSTSFGGSSSFLPDEDDHAGHPGVGAATSGAKTNGLGGVGASSGANASGAASGYVPSMLFQRHGSTAVAQVNQSL